MTLASGTRLGPYEIHSALGAGGMGEVYRAHDTKLGRDVALKVVAESFARDPERSARFHREAQLLAALNHPHIATIHGLEEAGDTRFFVMELVEGETLADRLSQEGNGLPVDEALRLARQVADALQAAHDKGIIHRDLKPANIALTADGQVKVLDFGLAKALDPVPGSDVSASPTLSFAATQMGVVLGTAAYMSPEQARGRPTDKRSDIWAFGCVLYEMLTGKRAFDGEDVAVVLASVIKGEPDWAALPVNVPAPIVTLLRGCLEKERRSRVSDIGAAIFVLDHRAQLDDSTPRPPRAISSPVPLWRRAIPMAATLGIGALLAGGAVWVVTRPPAPATVRTTLATDGSAALVLQGADRDVAITPDGSRIVYRGNNQLVVRALNQLEPSVLSGLGAPRGVFISPDGQWIGFSDGSSLLKKVAITGGPPVTISSVDGGGVRGATWGPDGTIIFATIAVATGLQRLSAAGGEPTVLTKPDRARGEGDHLWPEFLPGGEAVLFTIAPIGGSIEAGQIAVFDLQTGTSKVLIRGGSHAHYVPSGHLVYGVAGTLRAVAFDLERLEVVGTPAPVLDGAVTTAAGAADIAVAANGSLVYVPGVGGGGRTVVSVDRQGRASALPALRADEYRDVRVSPDGTRLALANQDDIWVYDLARATLSRLTTDPAPDTRPLWTPDGQRIVFTSARAGYPEIFWRSADGSGSDERLLTRAKDVIDLRGIGWSADGRQLLTTEVSDTSNIRCAIEQISIERPSDVTVLLKNEFCNDYATVSPDGRWMAYHSNVSGRFEIYVERYPEMGGRQLISTGGGQVPVWSRDGRELFFFSLEARQVLAAAVRSGIPFVATRPQALFEFPMIQRQGGMRPYDIAPDGRFLIIRSGQIENGPTATSLILVQNWFEELTRLVPSN